jgi:hypothetical protein
MTPRPSNDPNYYSEPEKARRKLVAALRKRAMSKRYTEAERQEFSRMADAWEATLPKKKG